MNLTVAYRDRSSITPGPTGLVVALSPNLRRDRVGFDAELRHPPQFREAIEAFHEVTLGPSNGLGPVVTVASDALLFEGFAADRSSYGLLTVDRRAFVGQANVIDGTTNIDGSGALREGFPLLRSYRRTRLRIEPGEGQGDVEGEIELPDAWLRGFLRLQSAMSLPMRRVSLGREGLYNILAYLGRHKAVRGPRAIRFEWVPGRPVSVVLEPWEGRIELRGPVHEGPKAETIRVWGRDRLHALGRLLPDLDEAAVHLLGAGLPSFWSARMGEVRLLVGLDGRSTRDDRADDSALAGLAPPVDPGRYLANQVVASFRSNPAQALGQVAERSGSTRAQALAVLHQLAGTGRVVHDVSAGVYRWRPWMPGPISAEGLGPEGPETVAAREIARTASVRVARDETGADGVRAVEGQVLERPVSLRVDPDGRMIRGRCTCSHHAAGGLRQGPCRHLQALRRRASARADPPSTLDAWFDSFGV